MRLNVLATAEAFNSISGYWHASEVLFSCIIVWNMHLAKSSYTGTADILSLECPRELKLVFGWQWMKLWDQHTECSEKGANTIQWLNVLWLILQSIKGREKSTYLYLSLLQAFYSSSPIFSSTFTIQYLLKNITFQFLTSLLFTILCGNLQLFGYFNRAWRCISRNSQVSSPGPHGWWSSC